MKNGLTVDRKGIATNLLLVAVGLVVGVGIFWLKRIPVINIAWGLPILAFLMVRPLRLLFKDLAVEFSAEGLTDYTSGLGFVRWSEMVAAHKKRYGTGEFVELELKEPASLLGRLPWLRAQLWRFNMSQGFRGPAITANWVTGGADAVLAAIRTRVPASDA